ncbi:hypothetical protein OTU49_015882, partial [Cherax quadricarinatus]
YFKTIVYPSRKEHFPVSLPSGFGEMGSIPCTSLPLDTYHQSSIPSGSGGMGPIPHIYWPLETSNAPIPQDVKDGLHTPVPSCIIRTSITNDPCPPPQHPEVTK